MVIRQSKRQNRDYQRAIPVWWYLYQDVHSHNFCCPPITLKLVSLTCIWRAFALETSSWNCVNKTPLSPYNLQQKRHGLLITHETICFLNLEQKSLIIEIPNSESRITITLEQVLAKITYHVSQNICFQEDHLLRKSIQVTVFSKLYLDFQSTLIF